ncbi:MAG: nitroreductase family protein, partial [Candidatus Cryosericum sp.]
MDSGQQFLHDTRYWADMPDQPSDQQKGLPQPPLELPADPARPLIPLPDPKTLAMPAMDIRIAIDRRQSIRAYRDDPLSLKELSYLLWCTQGVKAVTKRPSTLRTVPSGGARHALETYLMVRAVTGLEPGIYRFLAIPHALQLVKPGLQTVRDVTELCGDQ